MHISNSRFDCYLTCPYRHYLRYYERLEPKRKSKPLTFGSDFHTLLQYRGDKAKLAEAKRSIGDTYYSLTPRQQQELGGDDYLVDLAVIFADYMKVYKHYSLPTHTERRFNIRFGDYKGEKLYFVGVIDEDYITKQDGEKVVTIGEHKTFGKRPEMDTLVMNTQKCLYCKAYQIKTDILPKEVIWDHIHSSPAQAPKWLEKSGTFSSAKTTQVTPYSYRRACKERGITDPAVLARAKDYRHNISNFFFRTPMSVIPRMVDEVWDGFVYTARDIVRQGHKNKTRHLTRDCKWCDFRDICNMELSGQNPADLIARNYREREDSHGSI